MPSEFTFSMLCNKCPDISRDMVKKVFQNLQKEDRLAVVGKGAGARWQNKVLPNNKGNNKGSM